MSKAEHVTVGRAAFDKGVSGGRWVAECLCGWTEQGMFARSTPMALGVAERLAEALGRVHTENPGVERAQTLCVECGAVVRPLLIVLHMREVHGAA